VKSTKSKVHVVDLRKKNRINCQVNLSTDPNAVKKKPQIVKITSRIVCMALLT